ncbi:MAG: tRNA pseudouridine(13) synthase TruD [Myxococcales bacterium]|jgi:tRNA pseudouridine13 synthase|nr:tRNA pseudouridine(13) synthase TruD [Myxococcales bacterium]
MKLKQRPEDFTVTESWRFDESPRGEWRVYAMDKQKISTFDAIERIARAFDIPRSRFSFCGLKDKQGRTRQLIAVRGADVDLQEPDLRLSYLGRTRDPLSAANTTSNRFGVTVRALTREETAELPAAVADVNRLGVINYFDSQRFGSLKHGQGFIAKQLIEGDFEAALHSHLATPSFLDKTYDAKIKAFWRDHWGDWRIRCTIPGAERYEPIIRILRRDPKDFLGAFLRIDPKYRALLVFTYQSYLWNESVRRYLMSLLSGQSLIALDYQAGKLLFPREMTHDQIEALRRTTFPLLAPDTKITDPQIKRAVDWVLGRERLNLSQLRVPGTEQIFFRHEERPIVMHPGHLLLGPARPDELNEGFQKIYLAFTLPPGAYATLTVRRLFSFTEQENREHLPAVEEDVGGEIEILNADGSVKSTTPLTERPPPSAGASEAKPKNKKEKHAKRRAMQAAAAAAGQSESPEMPKPLGFRAKQKLRKESKARRREVAEISVAKLRFKPSKATRGRPPKA